MRADIETVLTRGLLSLGLLLCAPLTGTAVQEDREEERAERRARPDVTFFYPVEGPITSRSCRRLRDEITKLVNDGEIQFIVFEFDTPGGEAAAASETAAFINDLGKLGVVTHAYVGNNKKALSAGTLLAFACRHLIMGDNSRIGDVAPIMLGKELGEKWQTIVRKDLVRYASQREYPLALVEAMVSKDLQVFEVTFEDGARSTEVKYLSGQELDALGDDEKNSIRDQKLVVKQGQLLTLDEEDAYRFGFTEHIVDNRWSLLDKYNLPQEIVDAETFRRDGYLPEVSSWWLSVLNHPFTKFMLIVVGILGFVIEIKVPGFGIPGLVGLTCFLAFFVGGYYGNTVSALEAGLFVLALALLAIEVFVIPGFGVAGIGGAALLFASLILSLQEVGAPFDLEQFKQSILVVVCGLGCAVILIFVVLHFLPRFTNQAFSTHGGGLISTAVLGPTSPSLGALSSSELVGQCGRVITALRPSGKIELNGNTLDVVAEGEFIDAGASVQIAQVIGNRIVVRPRV